MSSRYKVYLSEDEKKRRAEQRRRQHNLNIRKRMKQGDDLARGLDVSDTWFPPRPIIEKDQKEIYRIKKQ